jgi:hypothetical protein
MLIKYTEVRIKLELNFILNRSDNVQWINKKATISFSHNFKKIMFDI